MSDSHFTSEEVADLLDLQASQLTGTAQELRDHAALSAVLDTDTATGPRGQQPRHVVIDEVAHLVGDEVFDGAAQGRGRPPTPRRKPESEIVLEGINHIRSLPDGYARKVHGGSMGNAGEPDLDACVRGRACKFEAKAGSNTPSRIQLAALARWAKAGALVGWFRSVAELRQLLDHLDDREYVTDLGAPGCAQPCHQEAA